MRKLSSTTDALHIEGSLLPAECLQTLLEHKAGCQTACTCYCRRRRYDRGL